MNLRIKLTLFTVCFVLFASLAILAVTVLQIRQKMHRDIQTVRMNELKRLQNNLQRSVNFVCSAAEVRPDRPDMSAYLLTIISGLRKSTNIPSNDIIWVLDTGTASFPVFLVGRNNFEGSELLFISTLIRTARSSGTSTTESYKSGSQGPASPADDKFHLYWFARAISPGGNVLAAAVPLSNLDAVVGERTMVVESEIAKIIKDRMFFSLLMILACALAVTLFSKIISDPVNRLVILTESIADGRKGFSDRISITSRDEIGRLAASFNAMLDHIRNSMARLEVTASKYRELVENANSVIIHLDGNGSVLFVNEYAQHLFGYRATEIEGKNIATSIGLPVAGVGGEDMFLSPEKYPYHELEHKTRGGATIWVGWTNRPIYDKDKNRIETLCVGSDITKRREAEELAVVQQRKLIQADKMATLGILVSGMAHEINNPNNYIVLNAQTLLGMWHDIAPVLDAYSRENPDYAVSGLAYGELNEELPGMLKGISDGALRIKYIVQNLKDFSRMEPDDLTRKVDIIKVLDAARVILGNMIKKSTGDFRISVDSFIPAIRGNFQRIEQVVINLLANACQATDDPAKPICVEVAYRQSVNEVVVTVTDEGRGIAAADLKRIFDPFFTTKRDEGGTGLGLAVSYSIVKDHGGDLRLVSAAGRGTTAILTLPVA